MTATDPGGLAATHQFEVTIPNRPPVPVDSIAGRELMVDQADTLDVAPFFSDPDADPLTYTAAVSDEALVSASVSGSSVVLSAHAKGEAVVTVTATDDEGLFATQRFAVSVPNRPPMATEIIQDRTVFKNLADTVSLARAFSDPDGDPLTWTAETSDSSVVVLEIAGSDDAVIVKARSQGDAVATVTATDTEGLSASQSFAVSVPNRGPVATDPITDRTLYKRETVRLDLTHYFSDPDGDVLGVGFASTDTLVAKAAVTGTELAVRAGIKGEATLSVTVTDPFGLSAEQSFAVTVLNRAPVVTAPIAPETLHRRQRSKVDLAAHFGDPDGDALGYSAASSDRRIVRVRVNGSDLALTAQAVGTAQVTVTATDPDNETVQQAFDVTVKNRAPVAVGQVPDLEVARGSTLTLRASSYFSDPDGDNLTYEAGTADPGIAVARASGSSVTVTGVSEGRTTLTLTATDSHGLAVTQTAQVLVVRRDDKPRWVGVIPPLVIPKGSEHTLVVSGYFDDPNGDHLTYDATTEDPGIATVSVSGARLTITGVANGQTTLVVTATDPDNNSAVLSAPVTVKDSGQGPVAVSPIPEQVLETGETQTVSVAGHFRDPDGGSLTFAAESSDPDVVTAAASGSMVTLTGVSEGSATVTVIATDNDGFSASQTMSVTVQSADPTTAFFFDFNEGELGFTAGFAEYATSQKGIYQLTSGHRALPPPLASQSGLYLSGVNRSDDLFMFFKGTITGLRPGASYAAEVSVEIATNVPRFCAGVGGSPGESVYVKAGVTAEEPLAAGAYPTMNIDKGVQSRSGTQAVVLGNMANSQLCGQSSPQWELKALGSQTIPDHISVPADGRVWLLMGTDSGFESRTEVYFTAASVTLTPIPE